MKVYPEDGDFELMMNSNAVSRTGYAVRMKSFVLLTSLTCQNDGKCVRVKREYLEKGCVFGDSGMYIFFVKK
jgi:hypothetical protein